MTLVDHLWVPVLVIVLGSTAGLIRTLRATLLDELGKQYVVTAKAKGVRERKLLFKYPVRMALNPVVAGIGGIFPYLLAGQTVVAIVLNLPTLGPLLFDSLMTRDVLLSSSVLMLMALMGIFGVVVSDILLGRPGSAYSLRKGCIAMPSETRTGNVSPGAAAGKRQLTAEEKYYLASQWQLMWRKFRRHRVAFVSLFLLAALYIVALSYEFWAPYGSLTEHGMINAAPTVIHWRDKEGKWVAPFVYGVTQRVDMQTFKRIPVEDPTQIQPVRLFVHGESYKLLGLWTSDRHFYGAEGGGKIFLLGDR